MLKVQNLSVSIDDTPIVQDISFEIGSNEIFAVAGPNGAGKTMLIKAIMQIVPHGGEVFLNGRDISKLPSRQIAKQIGVLSQRYHAVFDYTARQVVTLGRYCHLGGLFSNLTYKDETAVDHAMALTGVERFSQRSILTLSGGELQRVFLAQLFAQDPQIIILDEPTNHLDLQYQIEIFELVKDWALKGHRAVMAVVHDLNYVYAYAGRSLLMKEGTAYALGGIPDVMTRDNLKAVYNIDVHDWMRKLTVHWR